jgi:hypothetical protein
LTNEGAVVGEMAVADDKVVARHAQRKRNGCVRRRIDGGAGLTICAMIATEELVVMMVVGMTMTCFNPLPLSCR